jgi:hypothetical protein
MNPHPMREIKSKAILFAFDGAGLVVYSQILDLGEFYEGEHLWDSWDRIKAVGIVRLVGALFDDAGNLIREYENIYDEETGCLLDHKTFYAREHLKTDERYQKLLANFARIRAQRSNQCE